MLTGRTVKKNIDTFMGAIYNICQRRMKKFFMAMLVSMLLIFATQSAAAEGNRERIPLQQFTFYLDEQVPLLMNAYGIPGVSMALIQNGEIVWTSAYGLADVEKGRKMTTDTRCRVESISKSVTAWGVMKLVEQGKIELDMPVQRYLKNWQFPRSEFSTEKITVRRLLSHNAGLPLGTIGVRYAPGQDILSLAEYLNDEAVLQQEPGAAFSYSNTGFNLLELLIEEVTGRDFSEYMAAEVLHPLGMNHSSFTWSAKWNPPVPNGYDLSGRAIPVYVYPDKASGGLFATVEDIALFVSAGMTRYSRKGWGVLSPQSINALYTETVPIPGPFGFAFDAYGLGHFIENLADGRMAVAHGGQGSGWMTHFHSVPQTGDGIVILTNSQRSWPFIALILNDWTNWRGLPSLGMYQIIRGRKILWGLIALIMLAVLWQAIRLGTGILSGLRRFTPLSKKSGFVQIMQYATSAVALAALIWSANQDYLFISSLFPVVSGWLGWSALVLAALLLLSAVFPYREVNRYHNRKRNQQG